MVSMIIEAVSSLLFQFFFSRQWTLTSSIRSKYCCCQNAFFVELLHEGYGRKPVIKEEAEILMRRKKSYQMQDYVFTAASYTPECIGTRINEKVVSDTQLKSSDEVFEAPFVNLFGQVLSYPTTFGFGRNHLLIDRLILFLFKPQAFASDSIKERFYLEQLPEVAVQVLLSITRGFQRSNSQRFIGMILAIFLIWLVVFHCIS